jgi:hypothetical protein
LSSILSFNAVGTKKMRKTTKLFIKIFALQKFFTVG